MNAFLLGLVGGLAVFGVLTLCGLYQDGKTRQAQKKANLPRGPNLTRLLVGSVKDFMASFTKKKTKVE